MPCFAEGERCRKSREAAPANRRAGGAKPQQPQRFAIRGAGECILPIPLPLTYPPLGFPPPYRASDEKRQTRRKAATQSSGATAGAPAPATPAEPPNQVLAS
jgi:hypothetical protein